MNTFMKFIVGLIMAVNLAIITFPVTSINASELPKPTDVGILVDLNIEVTKNTNGKQHTRRSKTKMWAQSGEKISLKIDDDNEVEIISTFAENDMILIDSKIYQTSESSKRELIAEPKIFTKNRNLAIIEMGDQDESSNDITMFRMEVTPSKKLYSDLKK